MISGVMVGSVMFDNAKSSDATLQATKTLDDAIESVSDDELPPDHEDGEISEDLSDIFRSSVELRFSLLLHFKRTVLNHFFSGRKTHFLVSYLTTRML